MKRRNQIQRKYCTDSLAEKLSGNLDINATDPFIRLTNFDQPFPFIQILSFNKTPKENNEYIVSYPDGNYFGPYTVTIHLKLAIVNDRYKIASVH